MGASGSVHSLTSTVRLPLDSMTRTVAPLGSGVGDQAMYASEPPLILTSTSPGPPDPLVATVSTPMQPMSEFSRANVSRSSRLPRGLASRADMPFRAGCSQYAAPALRPRSPCRPHRPLSGPRSLDTDPSRPLPGPRSLDTDPSRPPSGPRFPAHRPKPPAVPARPPLLRSPLAQDPGRGRNSQTGPRVPSHRWCAVSPGPQILPSRNTVRLEPRCATRREATTHQRMARPRELTAPGASSFLAPFAVCPRLSP